MNKNRPITGILWILAFCLLSVTADGILRYLTMHDTPPSEILFFRNLFGTLVFLPYVIKTKTLIVTKPVLKLYIYRGFYAFCSIAIWFHILRYTDFTALITVGFTAPLFTSLLSIIWLREKYQAKTIAALLIGLAGAIVVINPDSMQFDWYLPAGILSSLFWAICLIYTKKLSADVTPLTSTFYFAAVITPLALIVALPNWRWPTNDEIPFIAIIVVVSTFGQYCLNKAFSYSNLTTLMPFDFSQLIFAAIFSYVVFGDLVDFNTVVGGVIIFASGYIVIKNEHMKHVAAQALAQFH